ncbi:amidase family protein [Mycolicibacterium holsaticum]|jgi:amidase|uniref:amidase family protein n=1 Tax=Mycolicibacterium holsaticum TaxID=152142 RepID=UPI001C7DDD74|nr:amidase family protein [Mycolicibacterium holsaticum]QZA14161.1 amidase [Mycolicibacterium holsaticum DSM 44478 = JCM 12374]UNC08384.1 amidase [Mycolicibacterium holsaticum DSM 44478 = JCM 12374]
MTDIALQPAHRLAEAIRRGELSSRELLEHHLARVARYNPPLNAVVTLDPDGARRAADAADAALARNEAVGPLHGVPMTVKDTYQTAGMRTTCGHPEWDHVPERDAEAVRRLRAAGAVIFGKTNTPPRAADWQTFNPIFGTTNNPWDTSRSPGGSSGGAAAALATGLTALELGSDIAGSIRVPANWCGVSGHKPSWGIVPQRGHLPPPPEALAESDLGVMGPMARNVADLELALDILAGPTGPSAVGWRLELPRARASTLGEVRLATWLQDADYPVEADVGAVLDAAVAALSDAGARLVDVKPPVTLAELVGLHQVLLYPLMDTTSTLSHRQWMSANERREQLRAKMAEYFCEVDAVLMPITVVPAVKHDHHEPFIERLIPFGDESRSYFDLFGWVGLATVAYLPATAVPVGRTAEGLPVGLQVVGPYLEDRTTLMVARHLEQLLGGFVAPPGFT